MVSTSEIFTRLNGMTGSSLISFKLDSNLDRMWRAIGLSPSERQTELQKLETVLITGYRSFISDTQAMFEDLREQLRQSQVEFKRMQQVFGDSVGQLPNNPGTPLRDQIAANVRAKQGLTHMYEVRIQEFEIVHAQLTELFDLLGMPVKDRGEFAEVGETDLTVERLARFKTTLSTLTAEKGTRVELFHSLKARISGLLDELDEVPSDEVQTALTNEVVANEDFKTLIAAADQLEKLKEERTAQIAALMAECDRLYLLLAIDGSDRVPRQTRPTREVLKLLRDEVDFLNEEKGTRLPQVVKGAKKEVARISEQLKIPQRDWPKFAGGTLEEEAEFLTTRLQELKELKMQAQPIIEVISQIESCREALSGRPNQGQEAKSGTRRHVADERAKKDAREQLPKLERRLLTLLLQYREQNGRDFEFNGVNYGKSISATADRQAHTKKIDSAKHSTLAQQILMEKMNESMAFGVERRLTTTSLRQRNSSMSRQAYA
jgi:hypothetical protein